MRVAMVERGRHTEKTGEEAPEVDDAVARPLLRRVSPARVCSGESTGASARGGGDACAGGEKARVRRRKKASPAPLFIGEAW